jgi:hypothetical protein
LEFAVDRVGFEPTTSAFSGPRYYRLSYLSSSTEVPNLRADRHELPYDIDNKAKHIFALPPQPCPSAATVRGYSVRRASRPDRDDENRRLQDNPCHSRKSGSNHRASVSEFVFVPYGLSADTFGTWPDRTLFSFADAPPQLVAPSTAACYAPQRF